VLSTGDRKTNTTAATRQRKRIIIRGWGIDKDSLTQHPKLPTSHRILKYMTKSISRVSPKKLK
jgi:hypothetical protein